MSEILAPVIALLMRRPLIAILIVYLVKNKEVISFKITTNSIEVNKNGTTTAPPPNLDPH
jgi:hypothetical protein